MHLVKWFRKNMTKLMAIFVILIMVAFIMPTVLTQLAKPRSTGLENAMWLYGKDKKITVNDLREATAKLTVLRGLYVDKFLLGQQDLRSILLGQILFPESVPAALLDDEIKKLSIQNRLSISPSRIDEFFAQSRGRAELFLIALGDEAASAGCVVPAKQAGEILNIIIPQVTNNQVDAATAVKRVCSANNMSDAQGLEAFADILSIMTYARIVGDTENVTESQLENIFARAKEKINAEFVQFNAENFLDKASEPDSAAITEQFEKYKNYLPGTVDDDNPYGFGYKLMPRVALEYMIVRLEDVKKLVAMPAEEETEDYYQHNLERFVEEMPAESNAPDAKPVTRQKSYAEVADMIKRGLYAQKASSQGTKILNRAVEQAETNFDTLNFEKADVNAFRSKAGDYSAAAEVASKEYNIKIYTGKTALISAEEIQADQYLGGLMMTGQSRVPTRLSKLAFAVKPLGSEASKLGPFEPAVPKLYVSVGPLSDMAGNIMAVVRVVETAGSAVPADIGLSYQKNLPELAASSAAGNKTFVLKDIVAKDCKRLQAMKVADKVAGEFLEMVKKQSWDSALEKINASYGKKDSNEPNKKTFAIQTFSDSTRVSKMDIEVTRMRTAGMAGAEGIMNQSLIYSKLMDTINSEFEDIQAKKVTLPAIIGFQPRLSFYVIKSLTRDSGAIEDYEQIRQQLAFQQDYIDSQSMSVEHFLPDNILKRLNLRPAQQEPNSPADSNNANGENQ
ncbi:MAG: hypothetical protein WC496_06255 [Phycisphaerae bacterium]|jgi:hypothetical protein